MGKKDPRVDAYIAKSRDFAKPILNHLRKIVHKGCPEVVEGTKWSMPHFSYKGMFCGMAAFKQHCTFGFWKHALLVERVKGMPRLGLDAMGQFGCLTSLRDLPSDAVLLALVKEGKRLNDEGIALPKRKVTLAKDRVLTIPAWFMKAVRKNTKALTTAVEWMAQGKGRNWKYEKC